MVLFVPVKISAANEVIEFLLYVPVKTNTADGVMMFYTSICSSSLCIYLVVIFKDRGDLSTDKRTNLRQENRQITLDSD